MIFNHSRAPISEDRFLTNSRLLVAALAANSRTTCQTTFSVMLSPQTRPARFTRRDKSAGSDSSSGQPNIKDLFHPVRHRYGRSLLGRQPVSQSHPQLLDAFHAGCRKPDQG
jgi:hypothetical protein